MLNSYIPSNYPTVFIKHLIVAALFVPYYTSRIGSVYYQDFILVNFFALLSAFCMFRFKDLTFKKETRTAFVIIGIMFVYDLTASFVNLKYLHWYSDQINITVSVGFFVVLLLSDRSFISDKLIRFFIRCIVLSNAAGLIFYLKCEGISFMNGQLYLIPRDPGYYEVRYQWLFHHKCEYSFMLVLFIAFFVCYRKLFKNTVTFVLSVGLLYVCLIAAHTYTSLIASFIIFFGLGLDWIREKKMKFKLKHILYVLPVILLFGIVMVKMLSERGLGNLGGRIPIWKAAVRCLQEMPLGVGLDFGFKTFPAPGLTFEVTNCHNLFMNQMFRYSIPVGICFIVLFVFIIAISIKNNFSFLTLGIWAALFIPMTMDYCMLSNSFTLVLLIIYCMFFRKQINYDDRIKEQEAVKV